MGFVDNKIEVSVGNMDYMLKGQVVDHMFERVTDKYSRSNVSSEEFREICDEGLFSEVQEMVTSHYQMVDLDLVFTVEDLYELHTNQSV